MPLIYIVRHGETDANVKGLVNDKNVITPLNKTGKMQAAKTGKYFKKYRCKTNSSIKIYSSPSIRTKETAELVRLQGDTQPPSDQNLPVHSCFHRGV